MRSYYDLIQKLKSTFESVYEVGTVTTEGYLDLDNWRKNIYPIVDIYVTSAPLITTTTALSRFNVEIVCLDVRDWNNEEVNDKFYRNDNRHDVWNTTHAILEQGKDKLIKSSDGITLESVTDLERISYGKENGLDGWRTSWVIDVPKTYNTACELLEQSLVIDKSIAGQIVNGVLTFTDAVTLNTGTLKFYDSGNNLLETYTESVMSVTDNVLTVVLTGGSFVGVSAGSYTAQLSAGLVSWSHGSNLAETFNITIA